MAEASEIQGTPDAHRGAATLLLHRINDGDSSAAAELLPLVYNQLRAMAGGYFKAQNASHTLQPTALVHEAYLKLVGSEKDWKSRPHFCAVAATAMRQILMDHARGKRRAKRAGKVVDVTIDDLATPGGTPLDLVALDDAMAKLAQMQERSARIVELRFFGGLTNPEISQVLGISTSTVERDWRHARAWLRREFLGEKES